MSEIINFQDNNYEWRDINGQRCLVPISYKPELPIIQLGDVWLLDQENGKYLSKFMCLLIDNKYSFVKIWGGGRNKSYNKLGYRLWSGRGVVPTFTLGELQDSCEKAYKTIQADCFDMKIEKVANFNG